ncbi:baseplate J/gp47 family protein [Pseudoalteromonas xiamenensis]|uniref:baseplate assembly protein n=1 Tax=Pseudoalteromonas xiamenensis TaxID=882626 RepID=UPI0027E49E9C|nr:baseplate J/gp47 family protein [Pseudoalteromonas xiamenensis]WMN59276.1 baseplate J/gp47 family protein [Pseudoalteromonas xiamenensis]
MSDQYLNLASLARPDIIENLDFERILAERKARFLQIAPNYADALALESDPLSVCLEVESYRELLLRQRINEAVYANLLATAQGNDLVHLGAFYGVERLERESDEAFRGRIRDSTIASSTAGSAVHYRRRAMASAPAEIRDISVSSPGDGLVEIAVLAKPNCDVESVVMKVKAGVSDPSVKMLTDTLSVFAAEQIPVNVDATIYLKDNVPASLLDSLQKALSTAWQDEMQLGWDLTPSWLNAQLHKQGVHQVILNSPTSMQTMTQHQCAVPGEIVLTLGD